MPDTYETCVPTGLDEVQTIEVPTDDEILDAIRGEGYVDREEATQIAREEDEENSNRLDWHDDNSDTLTGAVNVNRVLVVLLIIWNIVLTGELVVRVIL
jgi:hypothetical protein